MVNHVAGHASVVSRLQPIVFFQDKYVIGDQTFPVLYLLEKRPFRCLILQYQMPGLSRRF